MGSNKAPQGPIDSLSDLDGDKISDSVLPTIFFA